MEIILLRHGQPNIDPSVKISACEYGNWLDEYNQSSIHVPDKIESNLFELASKAAYIVCSDLPRSIDSARALCVRPVDIADKLFREFEIPYVNQTWPRLSAANWTVLFRLMWLMGYSTNAESFRQARQRAVLCMQRLAEYAWQRGSVLFIGHGSLCWYLDRLLRKNNWQCSAAAPRRYWEYATYTLQNRLNTE